MKAPEPTETLYTRIKKSNKRFLEKESKALGFRSVAQFLDAKIDTWKKAKLKRG